MRKNAKVSGDEEEQVYMKFENFCKETKKTLNRDLEEEKQRLEEEKMKKEGAQSG